MARVLKAIGFCLSAALLMACGQGALNLPKPAPRSDVETRAPRKLQRELPKLLAPPPAYGNKIVMASGELQPSRD